MGQKAAWDNLENGYYQKSIKQWISGIMNMIPSLLPGPVSCAAFGAKEVAPKDQKLTPSQL